jgi:uncharacterized protein YkwD
MRNARIITSVSLRSAFLSGVCVLLGWCVPIERAEASVVPAKPGAAASRSVVQPEESPYLRVGCSIEAINEIKAWTNHYRNLHGIPGMHNHGSLDWAAYMGSYYQSVYNSLGHFHTAARMNPIGFRTWGENVAYGWNIDNWQIFVMWWNSTPHRNNMLSRSFTHHGTWCVQKGAVTYWTTGFGG